METTYSKSTKYPSGMPTSAAFQQHLDHVPAGASTTVYFDAGEMGIVPFDITSTWTEADLLKQQTADRERAQAVEDAKAKLDTSVEPPAPVEYPTHDLRLPESNETRRSVAIREANQAAFDLVDCLQTLKTMSHLDVWLTQNADEVQNLRDWLEKS